jgi:hypothetical protein
VRMSQFAFWLYFVGVQGLFDWCLCVSQVSL